MSMFQLKNLYNGARVPVTGDKDQLKNHFLTGMNMIIRDHILNMTAFLAFLTPSPSDRKITIFTRRYQTAYHCYTRLWSFKMYGPAEIICSNTKLIKIKLRSFGIAFY